MFEFSMAQEQILRTVREFLVREVVPYVDEWEHKDRFPAEVVERMKELGFFGFTIGEEYGGLGIDLVTYARVVEEIASVWMSLAGILNSHLIMAYIVEQFGTDEQKGRLLPAFTRGEKRGGLCITEPNAGSDVQAIQTTALRSGDHYLVNGEKMFVSNGIHGDTFALLTKTDPAAELSHRGMSLFIIEKGGPGFVVTRKIEKLGYHEIDTAEFKFEDFRVPAANLVGGREGEGFRHVMSGLELGRVNVAARGVGVARAAFEASVRYAQQRHTMGKPIAEHQAIQLKLANMGTKLEAARLMTLWAAERKQSGVRSDLEVGMAKLFATEVAQELALEGLRIHGGYGYTTEFPVERYYRDAPMLLIGEGTSEIQSIVIARSLVKRYAI